jgi:hypothetical protein
MLALPLRLRLREPDNNRPAACLREHSRNIQEKIKEHSGNIKGAFGEHSRTILGPFR